MELKEISNQLAGLAQTKAICENMMKTQNIKIVEVREMKEGEAPSEISINGDIVIAVLEPMLRIISQRKEKLLAAKEQALNLLETQLHGQA
jgi:hypothetical protein